MRAPNPWKAHGFAFYAIPLLGLAILLAVYLPCLFGGDCPK